MAPDLALPEIEPCVLEICSQIFTVTGYVCVSISLTLRNLNNNVNYDNSLRNEACLIAPAFIFFVTQFTDNCKDHVIAIKVQTSNIEPFVVFISLKLGDIAENIIHYNKFTTGAILMKDLSPHLAPYPCFGGIEY